jgi:hypothetical protein
MAFAAGFGLHDRSRGALVSLHPPAIGLGLFSLSTSQAMPPAPMSPAAIAA